MNNIQFLQVQGGFIIVVFFVIAMMSLLIPFFILAILINVNKSNEILKEISQNQELLNKNLTLNIKGDNVTEKEDKLV